MRSKKSKGNVTKRKYYALIFIFLLFLPITGAFLLWNFCMEPGQRVNNMVQAVYYGFSFAKPLLIDPPPQISKYNYIIGFNGSDYYALNGFTGEVVYIERDFTTFMQNVLDSSKTGNLSIYLKHNNYVATDTIYINQPTIKIEGAGLSYEAGGTQITRSGNFPIFVINGAPAPNRICYITMRDILFHGNSKDTPIIVMKYTDRNYFENLEFRYSNEEAISLNDVWDSTFLSCNFLHNGNTSSGHYAVKDVSAEYCGNDGSLNINAVSFIKCRFEVNDGDLYLGKNAHFNQITDTKFHGYSTYAGHDRDAGLYSIVLNNTYSNQIISCFFIYGGTIATIYKPASNYGNADIISACDFIGNVTNPYYGMAIYSERTIGIFNSRFSKFDHNIVLNTAYTQGSVINSNILSGVNNSSIWLNHTNNIVINGNYITQGNYGLVIDTGSYLTITDNNFKINDYGIYCVTAISASQITDNIFNDQNNESIFYAYAFGDNKIRFNIGYITENQGIETIIEGTSVTFNHGLVKTPTFVSVNVNATGYGEIGVTSITSTQITVTLSNSGNYTIYWQANCW